MPATPVASSISSALLPTYAPLAVSPSNSPGEYTNRAPDAFDQHYPPVVDISIQHPSHEQPPSPAETTVATVGGPDGDTDTQMKGRKAGLAAVGTFFGLFTYAQIYQNVIFSKVTPADEQKEELSWVGSSKSWVDRRMCNWFGLCGLAHLNQAHWKTHGAPVNETVFHAEQLKFDLSEFRESAKTLPKDWSEKELKDREIPQYVMDHAPLIHLYSGEEYWPCDMEDHLFHTTPHLNYTPLQAVDDHPTLDNLYGLNKWGRFVYLQSDDNVEDYPEWLGGKSNIPNVPRDSDPDEDPEDYGHFEEDKDGEESSWFNVGVGDTKEKGGIRSSGIVNSRIPAPTTVPKNTPEGEELVVEDEPWQSELRRTLKKRGKKVVGGKSDAPAVLIVVPKENGVVDAFWFFFYSYNLGNAVFNVRFGNHVGDWEHTTVRFQNGVPKAVFFSEHSFGEAYTWDAIEKSGKRVRSTFLTRVLVLTTTACRVLCDRHACHVCNIWYPPLRPPRRHPPRRHRPRPALGPHAQHVLIHVRLPTRRSQKLQPDALSAHRLLLLPRPLGRQVLPAQRPPPVPLPGTISLRQRTPRPALQEPGQEGDLPGQRRVRPEALDRRQESASVCEAVPARWARRGDERRRHATVRH